MNIEDLISQYIDGELSSEAEAELHHRLSVSPEDRRLFREHVDLREAARSRQLQHHPSRSMEMALFARLAAEEGAEIPERVTEPTLEPAAVPAMAELHPLEPAPAPVSRSIAADAAPVRSDRQHARRRRLVPLLVPFLIGVVAMGLFWRLFLDSPDNSAREIASNDAVRPSTGSEAGRSTPATPEGTVVEEDGAEATASEPMIVGPLSEGGGVMSDAGPRHGGEVGGYSASPAEKRESSVRQGRASASDVRMGDDAMVSNSASGMGAASAPREMESSAPPPPPSTLRSRQPEPNQTLTNRRGGGNPPIEDRDIQTQGMFDGAAEAQEMQPAETPIEYTQTDEEMKSKAPSATLAIQDTVEEPRQFAESMQKPVVPPAPKTIAPPEGTISQIGDAFFDSDRATLKSDARASLDYLVDLLNSYPEMRIEIQGHTDSEGSEDRNNELSESRARAVREYLTRSGIDTRRMEIAAMGAKAPLAPNTTKEGKKLNRRVVIVVKDYRFTR